MLPIDPYPQALSNLRGWELNNGDLAFVLPESGRVEIKPSLNFSQWPPSVRELRQFVESKYPGEIQPGCVIGIRKNELFYGDADPTLGGIPTYTPWTPDRAQNRAARCHTRSTPTRPSVKRVRSRVRNYAFSLFFKKFLPWFIG